MKRLAGRVALVTGAGRGIGRSVALQLAGEGARIVLNDLDDEPAREAVSLIEAQGGEAKAVTGSVTDAQFPRRFVEGALDHFGAVDIVVNNAGYVWNSRIEMTSDEQWNAMIDVHLTAPFRMVRQVVQHWKQLVARDGGARRRSRLSAKDRQRFLDLRDPWRRRTSRLFLSKSRIARTDQESRPRTRTFGGQRQRGCIRLDRNAADAGNPWRDRRQRRRSRTSRRNDKGGA